MRSNSLRDRWALGVFAALMLGATSMVGGCDDAPDDAEDVGEAVDEAADDVADAVEDAADEVEDAADDPGSSSS